MSRNNRFSCWFVCLVVAPSGSPWLVVIFSIFVQTAMSKNCYPWCLFMVCIFRNTWNVVDQNYELIVKYIQSYNQSNELSWISSSYTIHNHNQSHHTYQCPSYLIITVETPYFINFHTHILKERKKMEHYNFAKKFMTLALFAIVLSSINREVAWEQVICNLSSQDHNNIHYLTFVGRRINVMQTINKTALSDSAYN